MAKHPDLLTKVKNGIGLITLNRPKALNALSLAMFQEMRNVLTIWAGDDNIRAVVVRGKGDRAFCAGGDIRSIYDAHTQGNQSFIHDLFREEYTLNYLIATYPKPYIAFIDGVVMGGGCGVSVHGSHRIVTERTVLAMPETAIGYFPDIGASNFLSQCPGRIGLYLGLTGARIQAADILYAGLADAFIQSSNLDAIFKAILAGEPFEEVIDANRHDPGPSNLSTVQAEIDRCFNAETLEKVMTQLRQSQYPNDQDHWVNHSLQALKANSPTSLEVSFKLLNNKDKLTINDSLITDYRIARRLIDKPDFYEGVRAVLVDKDNKPKWNPATLQDVNPDEIDACFQPLGADELILPPS